jgi:predicted PurR-regulated permease PerM
MGIVAAIAMIIFLLIGIKYVILLALIVGIFNLIPYVGIFTALLISMIVTFSTSDLRHTLFVGGGIVLIHLFDSNILMPRIVGSHVRINPLFVILGVVSGELLWGVTGMFLAIPYLAIAKVIFDRVEGLQPWGILLGEEEHTPKKIKPLQRWMKRKERSRKSEVGGPKSEG